MPGPWDGDFSSHPEVDTSVLNRDDYPHSLWDHPEPDIQNVVNLGDEGLSGGDQIDGYFDQYLDDNTRVEIPPGEYQWDRGGLDTYSDCHVIGLGDMGDVVLDHSGANDRVVLEMNESGVMIVEGIDVVGYGDPDGAGHRAYVPNPDSELIFKRYRTIHGTTPEDQASTEGFYMESLRDGESDGHQGTMRFLWCQVTRYGDNGLYCDGPIWREDVPGQIIVVGGEYRYCNISNIRIGHKGATVYGARITATDRGEIPYNGEYNQQRGIRIRQPGDYSYYDWALDEGTRNLIDQCEWYYPPGAGGGGMFIITGHVNPDYTSGRFIRCRMENHSGVDPMVNDAGTDRWEAHDVHLYGDGNLDSDWSLQGDSEVGSGADQIHSDPWWGLNLDGGSGGGGTIQPPSNLRVISTDSDSISVSWDAADQPTGVTLDRYNVYRNGGKVREVDPATTAATVGNLDADTQYEIAVSAVSGENAESGRISLTATTDDIVTGTVPIGGGDGYPFTATDSDADVTVSSLSGLRSALSSAGSGDVVFVEGDADIEIPTRSDAIVVPPEVTLASDRGQDGADGGRIYKDSWSGFGSGTFYGLVRVRANARVTGLRVEGNLPTSSTWYDASDASSVDDRMDAGIRVLGTDARVDNCEVYNVATPIVNGAENVQVNHNHLHGSRLYDPNDKTAPVSFGIHTEGARAPEPIYEHNLIEHCRQPFASAGNGGFVFRHNIVRGPILQPTMEVRPGGGTASTFRNVTAEVYQSDLSVNQLPNVRVNDVPDESAVVQDSHLYNPDAPVSSPTASDTDNAIVQIDSSTGDAVSWQNVSYSGNHYGSSDPPAGVGAIPLGDPDTIGRPDNLAADEQAPGEVQLSWDAPDATGAGVDRYNVYTDGRIRTETDASPASITVERGATVNFEVTAVDENGVESFPASITVQTSTGLPGVPANYTVDATTATAISVSWSVPATEGAGLDHYRVYRNGDIVQSIEHVEGQSSYSYTHQPLEPGSGYDVTVRAVDVDDRQSNAATMTATTDAQNVNAPSTPGLEPRDVAVTRVGLEVIPPDDTGSAPIDRYDLYVNGEFDRELPADTRVFVQTGLDPRTTYRFAIRAVNGDGHVSGAVAAAATTLQQGSNHRGTDIGEGEESCGFGNITVDAGPGEPTNLRVLNAEYNDLVFRWGTPEETGAGIDYYNVYVDGLIEEQTDGNDTTLKFPESEAGETRTLGVQAVDTTGLSSEVVAIDVTLTA